MSIIADVTRQFWIAGIKDVSRPSVQDLSSWFSSETYQVYDPLDATKFILHFSVPDQLLEAFASDCNRMAVAAFESIAAISKSEIFPKSTGWQVIQTYYSAFFAAHAILRMIGISCTQLEPYANKSIVRIADLYGQAGTIKLLEQGLYTCTCDFSRKRIVCEKSNGKRGVHEAFWSVFNHSIKELSGKILIASNFPVWDQAVSAKLDELSDNLCTGAINNGTWLSSIRNRVNYKLQLSTWYPYRQHKPYYKKLFEARGDWEGDPMNITMAIPETNELQRFHATCHFIVGLCRVMVIDMNRRSLSGKSFLEYGSVAVLRHIGSPV